MSSQVSAPAAPVSNEAANHTASASAPDATPFGSNIIGQKDASTSEPAVIQEQQVAVTQPQPESEPQSHPQPEASAATTTDSSEHDAAAAAVAAAAAAAAAADASSAAQTITELATAATNAANSAPSTSTEQPAEASAAVTDASESASAPAATGETSQAQQGDDDAAPAPATAEGAPTAEPETVSGLPRNVESELREIYSVSSAIANFSVAHVNQVTVPTPQKVRNIIQKALKLTSSLSMLLAQPEVALRQLDADEHGKRPAESKLDSARKRPRSSDWDGNKAGVIGTSADGLPGTPYTPNAGLRVFPDGSLPTSFPSPGFDSEVKGPQYKKRSRAPAPGSCQACGTTETPEWRRGPDGARTLCNACGLHYAKLVRKRMQQEGGEEPSPSQPPPQVSLVSLEELRASTKSAEAAAAAGLTPSGSSKSLNGTPMKLDRNEAWVTPSKPPRVASSLGSSVVAGNLEGEVAPPPPAAPEPSVAQPQQTAGIVEPAPTPAEGAPEATVDDSVINPELTGEGVERPMETDA